MALLPPLDTEETRAERPLFRFAQVTDTHIIDDQSAEILRATIREINEERPDFVLFTGDMLNIGTEGQYALFQECLRALKVPYRMLPGNHDLGNAGDARCYTEAFGPLNSSWEIAGIRCLALDTNNTDPSPENWHGLVEAPAMAWLRDELARIPREMPLLLFTHHGLVGRPEDLSCDVANAEEVLALFEGRPLLAGFCGHAHRLLLNRWQGIPFYAAPPLSTSRESIGVPSGFLYVDVFPRRVRVRLEIAA